MNDLVKKEQQYCADPRHHQTTLISRTFDSCRAQVIESA